jgi:hypothetical protein
MKAVIDSTLVISNCAPGEDMFENEFGMWNVTRAQRDCEAGKHQPFLIDIASAISANTNIECDDEKIQALKTKPLLLARPLIGVMENGRLWLIDGHHRLRAMHQLGLTECACFVIEEKDDRYRILFNGKRLPPWAMSGILDTARTSESTK